MESLSASRIRERLDQSILDVLDGIEVFAELESTNDYLLAAERPAARRGRIVLAESQSAGRGRLKRRWHSPHGSGVYLSILWNFGQLAEPLQLVPLAAGVLVADELQRLAGCNIEVKWPNDLLVDGRKLGGILCEALPVRDASAAVVVGVGINVDFAGANRTPQGAIDLAGCAADSPERHAVAAALVSALVVTLSRFAERGFEPFREGWLARDWLSGRQVTVETGGDTLAGTVRGIDHDGALLLDTPAGPERLLSGSITLAGVAADAP